MTAVAKSTEKSAQAFRTISEVSDALGVPQHVLRFWETKFSMIKPLKRGGNRRYYRPEDIDLLKAISHMLYVDGYTIKGVQKLLREKGLRAAVTEILERQGDAPDMGDRGALADDDTDLNDQEVDDPDIEAASLDGSNDAQAAGPEEIDGLLDELREIRALLKQAAQ